MNEQQQKALAASLERAMLDARERLGKIDEATEQKLLVLLDTVAAKLIRKIEDRADASGIVPASELQALLGDVGMLLAELATQQETLLMGGIGDAAASGARVEQGLRASVRAGEFPASELAALPHPAAVASETVAQVTGEVMADRLQLSDRLWRNHKATRLMIEPVLAASITSGDTARMAAREAVQRGLKVDEGALNRIELARAGALGEKVSKILRGKEAKAFAYAQRVLRTEINRANVIATRKVAFAVNDVVGSRFKLSPLHPSYDICDVHASLNRYGLGKGVYPPGKSPLPAHPNTLSYEEFVFAWEITPKDREGLDDLFGHIKGLDYADQYWLLQSEDKVRVLREGRLREEDLFKPWREIEGNYP